VEYQREGFEMFSAVMDSIKEETVGFLFNLQVTVEEEAEDDEEVLAVAPGLRSPVGGGDHAPHIHAKGLDAPSAPANLTYTAPSESGDAEVRAAAAPKADDPFAGIARNAPCPCGSGKKFKQCHGAPGGPTGMTTRAGG
jgi:preprotein translocase subunit SecA